MLSIARICGTVAVMNAAQIKMMTVFAPRISPLVLSGDYDDHLEQLLGKGSR
jgi:hypothetical protein